MEDFIVIEVKEVMAVPGKISGTRHITPGKYRVTMTNQGYIDGVELNEKDAFENPDNYYWSHWRPSFQDRIGEKVFARTVTLAKVGVVVAVDDQFIWLHPCADVIETGAFTNFFTSKPKSYAVTKTTPLKPAPVSLGAMITLDAYDGEIPLEGGE